MFLRWKILILRIITVSRKSFAVKVNKVNNLNKLKLKVQNKLYFIIDQIQT